MDKFLLIFPQLFPLFFHTALSIIFYGNVDKDIHILRMEFLDKLVYLNLKRGIVFDFLFNKID